MHYYLLSSMLLHVAANSSQNLSPIDPTFIFDKGAIKSHDMHTQTSPPRSTTSIEILLQILSRVTPHLGQNTDRPWNTPPLLESNRMESIPSGGNEILMKRRADSWVGGEKLHVLTLGGRRSSRACLLVLSSSSTSPRTRAGVAHIKGEEVGPIDTEAATWGCPSASEASECCKREER